jgi:hypothetical protein
MTRKAIARTLALLTVAGFILVAPHGFAGNQVRWTVHVGVVGAALEIPVPSTLFQDRALPVKSARWQCFASKALRQDEAANTYSTMTVHCTDGETTVVSLASCQVGAHDVDKLSIELIEKTSNVHNAIQARCDG